MRTAHTVRVGEVLGRFQVGQLLYETELVRVFFARELLPDRRTRPCRIKVLTPAVAREPAYQGLLQEETKLLKRMRHPCILGAIELGHIRGMSFLVLEQVEASTLGELFELISDRHFEAEIAVDIGRAVLGTLVYAHRMGVAHGAISKHSICITPFGRVKIDQFGLPELQGRARSVSLNESGPADVRAVGHVLERLLARCEVIDPRTHTVARAMRDGAAMTAEQALEQLAACGRALDSMQRLAAFVAKSMRAPSLVRVPPAANTGDETIEDDEATVEDSRVFKQRAVLPLYEFGKTA